jgi:hypothetical protein
MVFGNLVKVVGFEVLTAVSTKIPDDGGSKDL